MRAPFASLRKAPSTTLLLRFCYVLMVFVESLTFFYDNVPCTLQLLVCVMCAITIGSYSSLIDSTDVEAAAVERMKPKDAYMFPVFGSITLMTAYCIIKFAPEFVVQMCIRLFFVFIGTLAIQSLLENMTQVFILSQFSQQSSVSNPQSNGRKNCFFARKFLSIELSYLELLGGYITIPLPSITVFPSDTNQGQSNKAETEKESRKSSSSVKKGGNSNNTQSSIVNKIDETDIVDVTYGNLLFLIIGFIASVYWFRTEHYLLNNLIGIAISIQAISFINPGSYFTAAVLLSLLFFYDIFWVFGTEVMVTVAKGINAPIKLIFPRPATMPNPSMLGLGDIVLPGIYIALLLRFDVVRAVFPESLGLPGSSSSQSGSSSKRNSSNNNSNAELSAVQASSVRELYFWTAMVGYLLSMGVCLIVMYVFDHAQPALLYLVPGVIVPVLILALGRGEFNILWAYDEEPETSESSTDSSSSTKKTD